MRTQIFWGKHARNTQYKIQLEDNPLFNLYFILLFTLHLISLSPTQYTGSFKEDDDYIKEFWSIVTSLTDKQKQQFLKFVTSCSRPPLLGFSVSCFIFYCLIYFFFKKKLMDYISYTAQSN